MNTTRADRVLRADDLSSRHHGPVICGQRPPYILPTRPPIPPAPPPGSAAGRGHDTRPLAHLTDDEYALLVDQILEDWDCPTLTELGLCRAHRLTLEELDALTDDPAFDRALACIRSIREKRRPEREAAARAQITDRLLGLIHQPQDTAARAKEVRLSIKQLLAMLGTPTPLGAEGFQPSDRPHADTPDLGAGGFQPPDRPQADAPHGGADFQSAHRPKADVPSPPQRGDGLLAAGGAQRNPWTPAIPNSSAPKGLRNLSAPKRKDGLEARPTIRISTPISPASPYQSQTDTSHHSSASARTPR